MSYSSNRNLSRQDLEGVRGSGGVRGKGTFADSSRRHGGDVLLILVLLLVGIVARLDFVIPSNFVIDADEAIVGLMAKHMSEGGEMPIFYYGQHYMGSLEPFLASLLFRAGGATNELLKAVPLAFSLGLIWLIYHLGLELGGRRTGRLAALFMAVPPVALTVWSGKARGGFIEMVFLGTLALLMTVRWYKDKSYRIAGILPAAFILGFGWWTNNQIIFFMAPTAYAVLAKLIYGSFLTIGERLRAFVGTFVWGVLFFLLGGLPFWIYNIEHDFVSFQMFNHAPKTAVAKHVAGLFSTSIPILLGAKHFWETDDIFTGSTEVAYSLLGFMLLAFFCMFPKDVLNLLRFKLDFRRPVGLILVFLVATFGIFTMSTFGYLVQAPRYLLPAYVGIFLLYALVIDGIASAIPIATMFLAGGVLAFHVASAYAGGRAIPGEPIVYHYDRVQRDHRPLIETLDRYNYSWIRTNYWIGYRLAFETNERIRFLVFQEPHQTRIDSYKREGRRFGEELMPLVLSPNQSPLVETALTALGYTFVRAEVGGYVLLHELQPTQKNLTAIPRDRFTVNATQKSENANLAADDSSRTRWGSGEPQKPGMEFSIDFTAPENVRGLKIDLSTWETDFPRGMKIEAELEDGQRKVLLDPSQYAAALYYLNHNPAFGLMFAPVRAKRLILTQTGSDPVFDWSIAELLIEQ